MVIGRGSGEKTQDFVWTSPNGLMTSGDFIEAHEALFRFMADNSRGDRIRLDFYGKNGELLSSASPSPGEVSKIFQALRLYKEIAFGEALGGIF